MTNRHLYPSAQHQLLFAPTQIHGNPSDLPQ